MFYVSTKLPVHVIYPHFLVLSRFFFVFLYNFFVFVVYYSFVIMYKETCFRNWWSCVFTFIWCLLIKNWNINFTYKYMSSLIAFLWTKIIQWAHWTLSCAHIFCLGKTYHICPAHLPYRYGLCLFYAPSADFCGIPKIAISMLVSCSLMNMG